MAFIARLPRFRRLRRVGEKVARLIGTGGNAAMTYGQGVFGVSPSLLLRQKRAVAATASAGGAGTRLV